MHGSSPLQKVVEIGQLYLGKQQCFYKSFFSLKGPPLLGGTCLLSESIIMQCSIQKMREGKT